MRVFPTLEQEIFSRGIKKNEIARKLGIAEKTFLNKLQGKTAFTWPEVCVIHRTFFPDLDKDCLFEKGA